MDNMRSGQRGERAVGRVDECRRFYIKKVCVQLKKNWGVKIQLVPVRLRAGLCAEYGGRGGRCQ